jgi:hypothetical protein
MSLSIEERLARIEQALGLAYDKPVVDPFPEYWNGMSEPDEFGRVKLEHVENVLRPQLEGPLKAVNASLPTWYFVAEAADVFKALSESQYQHIAMNTGTNASKGFIGRWGRAVKVEPKTTPWGTRWDEVDTLPDTYCAQAYYVKDALQEIETGYREVLTHTSGGTWDHA